MILQRTNGIFVIGDSPSTIHTNGFWSCLYGSSLLIFLTLPLPLFDVPLLILLRPEPFDLLKRQVVVFAGHSGTRRNVSDFESFGFGCFLQFNEVRPRLNGLTLGHAISKPI